MQTELTILTGHSRGMGRAMAQSLLAAGHRLLGISRGHLQGLGPSPGAAGELIEWQADLADGAQVAQSLQTWLQEQAVQPWRSVTLINNAALIINKPFEAFSIEEYEKQ
jgi:NAD(P)-dependent dehydrogenase (short-subunit alcohol dehydrogenase family)